MLNILEFRIQCVKFEKQKNTVLFSSIITCISLSVKHILDEGCQGEKYKPLNTIFMGQQQTIVS